MRAILRVTTLVAAALLAFGEVGPLVGISFNVQAQERTSFRQVLAQSIAAAERSNLVELRRKGTEKRDTGLNMYTCDLGLPGSAACAVYVYDGIEGLKNFAWWDYGEGKTRESAEQLFTELVENVSRGMPNYWAGQETPKSNLSKRTLREFTASAKPDGRPLGGPIITVTAKRRAELFAVKVELNAHHAD
jgi:hypothetical protein